MRSTAILEAGKITKNMVEETMSMPMGRNTKEAGSRIKSRARGSTFIRTTIITRVNGKRIEGREEGR